MVSDKRGHCCPASLTPTSFWPDQSIRSLAIKAVVNGLKPGDRLCLSPKSDSDLTVDRIQVRKGMDRGSYEIDTGPLRMKLTRKGPSAIEQLEIDQSPLLEPGKGLSLKIDLKGDHFIEDSVREIKIDHDPAEVQVHIWGQTVSRFGGYGPSFKLRFYLHPGSPWIDARITILGEEYSGRSEGIDLIFQPASGPIKPRIRPLAEGSVGNGCLSARESVALIARGSRLFCRRNGRDLPVQGGDWAGLLWGGPDQGFCIGVPRCRLYHPCSLEYRPEIGLVFSLLSPAFEWEEGFFCERDFVIGPGSNKGARRFPLRMNRCLGSHAFGLPKDPVSRSFTFSRMNNDLKKDPLYPWYGKVMDRLSVALRHEQSQWDGYLNYGDYRTSFGHFANNEFDPAYGLLKFFLLSEKIESLSMAETMLLHGLRIDRTGPAEPEQWQGVPWVHGEEHRSGEIELGHMWVDGLVLYHSLSADQRFLEAAIAVGKCMAGQPFDMRSTIIERSASWSLMALTALVETGHKEFQPAMDRAAALIRSRQTSEGWFRFSTAAMNSGETFTANVWVTAGITVEALYRHYSITGDVRSMESALLFGKWLNRTCGLQQPGAWCEKVQYRWVENELLGDLKSEIKAEDHAFVALGLARLGQLSGDHRYYLKARKTLERGLRELLEHPPEHPGRALAVIGRSAPDLILACMDTDRRG
ncbi:MAG: hypothetical protein KJ645_00165 [Planctomycetes bacterium]|nr:hypothetical protein [Planctomycetota bacterium]